VKELSQLTEMAAADAADIILAVRGGQTPVGGQTPGAGGQSPGGTLQRGDARSTNFEAAEESEGLPQRGDALLTHMDMDTAAGGGGASLGAGGGGGGARRGDAMSPQRALSPSWTPARRGDGGRGRGFIENKHSTNVESPPPHPRPCMSTHPEGNSCSDNGSSACS
jgi:hypothetical protein